MNTITQHWLNSNSTELKPKIQRNISFTGSLPEKKSCVTRIRTPENMIMNHKEQQTLEYTQWSYPSVEVNGKKPQYGSHCFFQHLAHTLRYYCLEPYVDRSAASLKPKSQPWASKLVCKLVSVQDIAKCNNKRARTHTHTHIHKHRLTRTKNQQQQTKKTKKTPQQIINMLLKALGGTRAEV